jgi:hypothetical protein
MEGKLNFEFTPFTQNANAPTYLDRGVCFEIAYD